MACSGEMDRRPSKTSFTDDLPARPEESITSYLKKYGPSRSADIARGIAAGQLCRMPVGLVWQILHDNAAEFELISGASGTLADGLWRLRNV